MANSIIMPRQGQSVESCIITKLYISEGDKVDVGDLLFAYETDKASFEEESELSGFVLKWMFKEGDEVPVLDTVCFIGEEGEDLGLKERGEVNMEGSRQEHKTEVAIKMNIPVKEQSSKSEAGISRKEDYTISPRARKMAEEKGLDPALIAGTGPGGRIIVRDIESSAGHDQKAVKSMDFTIEKLSNIRKLIAKSMLSSLQNSAQLTHHMGADARKILKIREDIKMRKGEPGYVNITLNDMLSYAVIKALLMFPRLNAHLTGDSMKLFSGVNLGIAVDTERGLMVPSIRQAEGMDIKQLAIASAEVADLSRKGSIDPDIIAPESATFTISNLGAYGVEMFTPVINLPQVAILGVNAILPRPADIGDGHIAFVPYVGLSLTYDHQAVDGGEATRFLMQVVTEIENMNFTY